MNHKKNPTISIIASKITAAGITLVILISCLPFSTSVEGGTFTVQGIGYPPIKAENSAQAWLMARRAAIIDAYRNALKGDNYSENHDAGRFYTGLSGFLRGARLLKEEYLSDGGVVVTMEVPAGSIYRDIWHGWKDRGFSSDGGPEKVSLDEWYRKIEPYVVYNTDSQN